MRPPPSLNRTARPIAWRDAHDAEITARALLGYHVHRKMSMQIDEHQTGVYPACVL